MNSSTVGLVPNKNRLETVDQLRGLAACAVCWFHFTQSTGSVLPDGWLKNSGQYGWLGVEVFFVISGFIVPWSLHRTGYRLRNYPAFLLKRVIRLEPPYLVTLTVIVSIAFLTWARHGFAEDKFELSLPGTILHLGYLNAFCGYAWLSPVFWTLAIEFQYYVLLGLLFPLLMHPRIFVRLLTLLFLCGAAVLVPEKAFVTHYVLLFLLGIATFYYKARQVGTAGYVVLLISFGLGCAYSLGTLVALTGMGTACTIAYVTVRIRLLRFLGDISYSLYLVHYTVMSTVVIYGTRLTENSLAYLVLLPMMTALSLLAAYALYRYVEVPAQSLASTIRYSSEKRPVAEALIEPSPRDGLLRQEPTHGL